MSLFLQIIGVLIGVGASAVTFRIPQSGIIWAGLTGLIGWEVQMTFAIFGFQPIACTLLGAITISVVSELLARAKKMPATIFIAPGILPLVPGMKTYDAMLEMVRENHELAALDSMQALLAAGGIAVGLLMGNAIANAWIHPYHPHKLKPRPEDNTGTGHRPASLSGAGHKHRKRKRQPSAIDHNAAAPSASPAAAPAAPVTSEQGQQDIALINAQKKTQKKIKPVEAQEL